MGWWRIVLSGAVLVVGTALGTLVHGDALWLVVAAIVLGAWYALG